MKVTGKYSHKPYKCDRCQREFTTGTNHWGEIYHCPTCGVATCQCLEPVPDGYGVPEKWRIVSLGEIAEIKIAPRRRPNDG